MTKDEDFSSGLDFLLTHLKEPLFPRHISTVVSEGKQLEVRNKDELLARAKAANYRDVKIRAYAPYNVEKYPNPYSPEIIHIDLDRSGFMSERALKMALKRCLMHIQHELNAVPTVLDTGGGYHIVLPIECPYLDEITEYTKHTHNASQDFLRFTEDYFTLGKADPAHNPSFRNMMLRVPNSINAKPERNNHIISIVQRWNGQRATITKHLAVKFQTWLTERTIKEKLERQNKPKIFQNNDEPHSIDWIETLLQTPITDYRKRAINLILTPYLINVRRLSEDEVHGIITQRLERCETLRRFDRNKRHFIRDSFANDKVREGIRPMRLAKLQSDYRELHDLIFKSTLTA